MLLAVYLSLGYRRLCDGRYFQNDEMVKEGAGLKSLPDVTTVRRGPTSANKLSVNKLRAEDRE
jgi:hypothetical protein